MSEPTFDDTPRLIPAGPTYEIRDSAGRTVRIGTILNGDFTIYRNGEEVGRMSSHNARQVDSLSPLRLSEPNYTFTTAIYRAGSGDGRGGNAHDRRKARRAGRLGQSLGDMVNLPRGAEDAPDALDLRRWTPLSGGEWKVTS